MSRPFDAKVKDIYRGRFPDLRVIVAFKAFPSHGRVTDGLNRPGESSSPLTVTRSCGLRTHFPFTLKHPGGVTENREMLPTGEEWSQVVSLADRAER